MSSQGELSMQEVFLQKIKEIVLKNLSNENFNTNKLAQEMGLSRSQVHRRLKKINGKSISQLIREIRLEEALRLLNGDVGTAAEISYKTGFNSPTYFNKCFHEYFGFPPGEVKKRFFTEGTIENEFAEEYDLDSVQLPGNAKTSITTGRKFTLNRFFMLIVVVLIVIALSSLLYFLLSNDSFSKTKLSQQDKKISILVLPFKNLSDDPDNLYFADGITEDILNNLYRITSLRVISRTSGEQFRESNLSTRKIARKMHTKYILEGSVRRYGDNIRISAQLIDAYRDDHLWSASFDRKMDDIIGIQDDIALQVASKLKAVLSENEIRKIEKISTQNPKAYDYYLQARFLMNKANSEHRSGFSREGAANCIKYYEKAIAEDENFAEAYAGLANAWFTLSAWKSLPPDEGIPKALKYSYKAIEIDPDCAEAFSILGAYHVWWKRNFEEGGKELRKSVQLNPNSSSARQAYAQYLMITGPIEDARVQINYALEMEPYFWVIQNLNAWIYYFEEKYDKAIVASLLARDLNPDFQKNTWLLFLNYAKSGDGKRAVLTLQAIVKHRPGTEQYVDEIREAYNNLGINGLFTWLIDVNKNKPLSISGINGHPFYLAWWNAILGNQEESVYWLKKYMESKMPLYFFSDLIATNPDFDILRNDPQFLNIIDEMGLTPYHNRKTR